MRVSLLQVAAQDNLDANLDAASEAIEAAMKRDAPDLVVLPEHFALRENDVEKRKRQAEVIPGGRIFSFLQRQARSHGVWIHGGSFAEKSGDAYHNTTIVFDDKGEPQARFRKMFMFDYLAPDGTRYGESKLNRPGEELVIYEAFGLRIGCTVCYDLRFPDLFMALARAGCDVIINPACFTFNTTRDHWEVLLRARAVDTQCYMIGANQFGAFPDGSRPTGGRSMIVDPWGTVVAKASDEVGFVTGEVSPDRLKSVRARFATAQEVRDLSAPAKAFAGGAL